MSGAPDSDELELLIAGYVLCDLSAEEKQRLDDLVAQNPAIAQEIETMQRSLEMAYDTSEIAPPIHLRSKILAAYEHAHPETAPETGADSIAEPVASQSISMHRFQATSLPRWVSGVGAAAAILILGLSVSNYWLWRSLQVAQNRIPSDESLTVSLESTDTLENASVQVMIDPATLEGTLQVDNLPPLPPGQVYVLWTVLEPNAPFTVDEKGAILTQVFTVDQQGQHVESLTVPVVYRDRQWVRAIAITVESADAPQQHRSSPLLIQPL